MTQITPGSDALHRFNTLREDDARAELAACCASTRWTAAVAAGRPYAGAEHLLQASDTAFAELDEADIAEALATHPRIGQRADGPSREASWSRHEQARANDTSDALKHALAEGNAAYEARFDRVFLICASGLSAEEVLANLHARLGNDDATERATVRHELRKITRIRLTTMVSADDDG